MFSHQIFFLRTLRTLLPAELLDGLADGVPDHPDPRELFLLGALDPRGVREAQVHVLCRPREDGTGLGRRLVADGDDIRKKGTRFQDVDNTLRVAFPEMSIPTSFMTATASGFRVPGSRPALSASKRSPQIWFIHASAIWLRALLWMHTKSTFFLFDWRNTFCYMNGRSAILFSP